MSDVDGARLTFEKLDSSSPSRSSARGHCIERSLSGLMISRATRYAPVRRPCFPFLPLSLIFISLYLFVRPPPRCRRTRSIRSCAWKLARAPRVSNERLNSHPPPPRSPPRAILSRAFRRALSFSELSRMPSCPPPKRPIHAETPTPRQ